MKETIKTLFEKSIELGDEEFTQEQISSKWIGNPSANQSEIESAEKRLGISLPKDYIELLTIANGFPTCTNNVEPSFQKVQGIDFYKYYKWNVIDSWKELAELEVEVNNLERAIMIAG